MQKNKLSGARIVFFLGVLFLVFFTDPLSFAAEVKGKVIMKKGNNVTIQLDGKGFVNKGDSVRIYQDAYGVEIEYGTWRVSKVKDDGTIEAEPDEKVSAPSPGLDAIVHATGSEGKADNKKAEITEAEKIYDLANGYRFGRNGVEKNFPKAVELYEKAADMGKDYRFSYCTIGNIYYDSEHRNKYPNERTKEETEQDYAEAFRWYMKGALKGQITCQQSIGRMYVLGHGVSGDLTEAEKWYRKAEAQYPPDWRKEKHKTPPLSNFANNMWFAVMDNLISMEDAQKKAIELYKESASNGSAYAQQKLKDIDKKGYILMKGF